MNMFKTLPDRQFLKQTFTLSSATLISQLFSFAGSLALFRLYTPVEYGKFGIFVTISSLLSLVSTGQFQHAIFVSTNRKETERLISIILGLSIVVSLLTGIVLLLFYGQLHWISFKGISLLPASVLAGSFTFLLGALALSLKEFSLLSYQKVYQAIFTPLISIGFGLWYQDVIGLIVGYLFGQILGVFLFYRKLVKVYSFKFIANKSDWSAMWKKFKNFPLFTLPSEMINALINQLPVLLLGQFFSLQAVGHYKMATTILNLPIGAIAIPVSAVFKQKAASALETINSCRSIFIQVSRLLFFSGVLPYLVLGLLGSWLLPLLFGSDWHISGIMIQVLAGLYFAKFVVSPLTSVTQLTGHQKFALLFNLFLLTLTSALFFVGYLLSWTYIKTLTWYALIYGSLYILTYFICLKFCSRVEQG